MSPNRTAFALLCLGIGAFAPLAQAAEAARLSRAEEQVLLRLYDQRYFFNSSCGEVSSFALKLIGLPALDDAGGKIAGRRGDLDRSRASGALPEFDDAIFPTDSPYKQIQIHAEGAGKKWRLTIRRRRAETHAIDKPARSNAFSFQSTFDFRIETQVGSRSTCELAGYSYSADTGDGHVKSSPIAMPLASCLNAYAVDPASRQIASSQALLDLYKADCPIALHYSKEAKKIVDQLHAKAPR